jgi:2-polyprenyl-3-methyl-5-hydroxy-6-metoxy-1,4-benzoquinol methylase
MTDTPQTDRQRRELEFYEEFSKRGAPSEVCFDPIAGAETRPWNSYWRVIEIVQQNFSSEGQRLLDFGCGAGESSLIFSRIGYEVSGFDLSPSNISIARRLARKYGAADRIHFSVSVAERLAYADEYFDVVVGFDILHHVNLGEALAECSRVLKRGGLAIFHEPMRVPLFDTLRETSFGRWLVPKGASLDRHITEDERKLTADDLEVIRGFDPGFSAERFLLLSRLDRFIRNPESKEPSFLERLDSRLFRLLPFLKTYGGVSVLILKKRNDGDSLRLTHHPTRQHDSQ